jgi:hypothetical protein
MSRERTSAVDEHLEYSASRSSFRPRGKQLDRTWMVLFIAAAIAVIALLASMIAVSTITTPTP